MSAHTPARLWVIYDERAILDGTDGAAVLESCTSLRDLRRSDFDGRRGPLGAVFEYDIVRKDDGKNWLENERFIGTVANMRGESMTLLDFRDYLIKHEDVDEDTVQRFFADLGVQPSFAWPDTLDQWLAAWEAWRREEGVAS